MAIGSSPKIDCPVLIVGAGPNGLLLAYLLSQMSVPSMIIERYNDRLAAPKAHELCPRSLEILRHAGLDSNHLRRLGTNRDDAYWVNSLTKLSAGPIGRLPFERMDPEVLDHTPEMVHNVAQPTVERFVQDNLPQDYEIRKSHSFVSCREATGLVYSTVENRETGSFYTLTSRFLIGADGARSKVRASLGIDMEGEPGYDTMMTIHFRAQLRPIVGKNLGMLNWVMDPEVSGFIIGYDLDEDQVLICNFDSNKRPVREWTPEHARKTVIAAIGKDIPVEVLSYRPWTFTRRVAHRYQAGNVFIVGDAAHCFPPTGGLGLNLGMADVHNLAYKLAAVYQGWARPALLDAYERERRPVAQIYSKQAMKYGEKIFGLLKTLGTTDPDVEKSRENLCKTMSDPAQQEAIHAGIEDQREHFSNLEMHLGYVYGDWRLPKDASRYTPRFVPGIRLPHAWVHPKILETPIGTTSIFSTNLPDCIDVSYVREFSAADVAARKFSTLDLCARDAFTFFVFSKSQHSFVAKVLEYLSRNHAAILIPFRTITVEQDLEPLTSTELGRQWLHRSGLMDGGMILVRPDQHILACIDNDASAPDVGRKVLIHLGVDRSHESN